MNKFFEKYTDVENCPIRNIIAKIGNKWSVLILLVLAETQGCRYGELLKHMPDISSKVMSKELRSLEADGLIDRKAFAGVPPRVEYKLTSRGNSLVPILMQLTEWSLKNMKAIEKSRIMYQQK